jgi:transposase-like protein
MEDRRCKLGLQGRRELVLLIEQGSTIRQAAACLSVAPATAHRWWHRWRAASEDERASLACLRTRSSRPHSCPWALSSEAEQAILTARERTNYGPLQLQFLTGRHRSTIHKVLARSRRLAQAQDRAPADYAALRMDGGWRAAAHRRVRAAEVRPAWALGDRSR